MLTLEQYYMGRDKEFSLYMTPEIARNSARTVSLANELLDRMDMSGIKSCTNPNTGSQITSGLRPAPLNAKTPGAAPNSKHMTGQAVDLYDPEGAIDAWLMTDSGQRTLMAIGLWMEHPTFTKGWSHVQIIPPASRNRVFYP